jgi:hypothetical protein
MGQPYAGDIKWFPLLWWQLKAATPNLVSSAQASRLAGDDLTFVH